MTTNTPLILAAVLNAIAALMHIGCIYFGTPWYRMMGASQEMLALVEKGSIQPTITISFISVVLFTWAAYALSGAGVIYRLPLLKWALAAITAVYLLRGAIGFFFYNNPLGRTPELWLWSSAICLAIGLVHLSGLKQGWAQL